jgi:hypothetical protein
MKPRTSIALFAIALAACAAQQPIRWTRVGPPVAQHQIDVDWAACRGQAQAQAASIPPRAAGTVKGIGASEALANYAHQKSITDTYNSVLHGCMADRGWLANR